MKGVKPKTHNIFFVYYILFLILIYNLIVVELGDDVSKCLNKRTLIIANHQSTADVPLMMATFNTKSGVLPNIMWIMDRLFRYTNFGICSLIHQDFFIASVIPN